MLRKKLSSIPGRSSGPGQEVREEDRPNDSVPEEEVLGPEKRAKGCCNKGPTDTSKSIVQLKGVG